MRALFVVTSGQSPNMEQHYTAAGYERGADTEQLVGDVNMLLEVIANKSSLKIGRKESIKREMDRLLEELNNCQ
jgi:hypothetical protein